MLTFAPAHFLILLLLSLPSRLVALDLDPVRVGGYDTSGSALGVALSGNYVYVADGGAGLQVIDVSNPATPQGVGRFDTRGLAGPWSDVATNTALASGLIEYHETTPPPSGAFCRAIQP